MKEVWFEKYCLYTGFLGWSNFQVGATLGIRQGELNLGWWTIGYWT